MVYTVTGGKVAWLDIVKYGHICDDIYLTNNDKPIIWEKYLIHRYEQPVDELDPTEPFWPTAIVQTTEQVLKSSTFIKEHVEISEKKSQLNNIVDLPSIVSLCRECEPVMITERGINNTAPVDCKNCGDYLSTTFKSSISKLL